MRTKCFFRKEVRPLLLEQCGECHNRDNAEGKLRIDSLGSLLRGGSRGPAVVPGKPEVSLLIRAVRHDDQLQMPPEKKLATVHLAILAKWVADGAVWPNAGPENLDAKNEAQSNDVSNFSEQQRRYWSFQPVARPALPELNRHFVNGESWVRNPIDAFVLDKLARSQLQPAPEADKQTLVRRIFVDLIGIPPTAEEAQAFVLDEAPDALDRLVERLLASPRYGERWGRHWLDMARNADSNGLDENIAYANAFHYRDYVIASFNLDRPYDRFVREQIAGDLLQPDETPNNDTARIAATGFLCVGAKMLAEDDPMKMQMDIIDEQVDTIGRTVMGLTLGCARCHDHKYDPISTSDYYSLAGIFKSTKTMDTFTVVARWHERPLGTREEVAKIEQLRKKIDGLVEAEEQVRKRAIGELRSDAKRHFGDYLLAAGNYHRLEKIRTNSATIGGSAILSNLSNVIVREAENFDRGTVEVDRNQYGKDIGVLLSGDKPSFAEYDFEVAAAGKYRFEVRYAAANRRACIMTINGLPVGKEVATDVTGSWTPESQRWFSEIFVSLKRGKNTLRIQREQTLPHIDKWLLAPAPEADAVGTALITPDFVPVATYVRQWNQYLSKIDGKSDRPFEREYARIVKAENHEQDLRQFAQELQRLANARDDSANTAKPVSKDSVLESVEAWQNADNGPLRVFTLIEKHFSNTTTTELKTIDEQREPLEENLPKLPSAMAVEDGQPENIRIHFRGSHLTQGAVVPRRFPKVFEGESPPIGNDRSGRMELAHWLTSPENPLTARVFVNRLWHWHFGAGIVRSPDNFGLLGEQPTHSEPLDWLADELMRGEWSTKRMHRLILSSSLARMSSQKSDRSLAIDPENRLWWRVPRKRLEAEAIRDSLLAVSGRLDLAMGGSLLPTENHKYVSNTGGALDEAAFHNGRRSVYLPAIRSEVYEVLQAFDFADPAVVSGARQSTTVAPQALFMMNSELVAECSKSMAERILADTSQDPRARVRGLYMSAFSRYPTDQETENALNYVQYYATRWQAAHPEESDEAVLRAWQSLCRSILAANEFVFSM